MPRYYFGLSSKGRFIEDDEGTELPDLAAARQEAARDDEAPAPAQDRRPAKLDRVGNAGARRGRRRAVRGAVYPVREPRQGADRERLRWGVKPDHAASERRRRRNMATSVSATS